MLSCGHQLITLYTQLFLGGWGLELEDLKALRTWGSKTPGHPEHGHTAGVETTTGRSARASRNAVGMAMAARRERGLLDPNAAEGDSPFDHHIYAICSDGDIEEGVSAEASSIAGTQQLGNLTVIYDANRISIEDDTDIAFTEDVAKRYEAYGWHVQTVDWTHDGTQYVEDVPPLYDAIRKAEAVTDRPSFIVLRTIIAWPAPNRAEHRQGPRLRARRRRGRRHQEDPRLRPRADLRGAAGRHRAHPPGWSSAARPRRPSGTDVPPLDAPSRPPTSTSSSGSRPAPCPRAGPTTCRRSRPTRRASPPARPSGAVINAIAPKVPELWGGSADLAESNNTTIEDAPSFLPEGPLRPSCGRATRSPAGCCTSASASTPWARS